MSIPDSRILSDAAELDSVENFLKQIYAASPQLHLEEPHDADYCQNVLDEAFLASHRERLIGLSHGLKEDTFFQPDMDVSVMRHLRYLPAFYHSHAFLEVVYVLQGSFIHYIKGSPRALSAGDILILSPKTEHAISVFSDDVVVLNLMVRVSAFETTFFSTLKEDDILSRFFSHTLYHSPTHPFLLFRTGDDPQLESCADRIYAENLSRYRYRDRMLNALIYEFFVTLLNHHESHVIVPDEDRPDADDNLIFILKYMQEHYKTVTLGELSDFFHYSERQLQRIIKNGTGLSFSENLQELKMKKAGRLLTNSTWTVTEIAEELGYQNDTSFRYGFKKYYNMTPAAFREKAQADQKEPASLRQAPS